MLLFGYRTLNLFFVLLLLLPISVFAADLPVRVDSKVRKQLTLILEREGYIGKYSNGQHLQRGISAYLWDHRQWLKKVDFHNAVQIDVLVCLMIKRGYPGFDQCAENRNFVKRCQNLIK